MTASGTAGYGTELAAYVDLSTVGAVVVKSLSAEPWPGNPAPRVHETASGMINSVGLQGPGVEKWLADELPPLVATGARIVASIWGSAVDDYARAGEMLAGAPSEVVAVEVNLSCPNHHDREQIFAHAADTTAAAIEASKACGRPLWAKLSPNVTDLASIAGAAHEAGAEAVTLVNTLMGMVIDPETRRPLLGGGGGGLSGRAIHPVAVRAVYDVRRAHPELPIVGVGGVASGVEAVELLLAGAQAVQVGTATFADTRAVERIDTELKDWCVRHQITDIRDINGGATD
jgi:dihydroorotate dehydrogenase (NAD+) catalytic subunit